LCGLLFLNCGESMEKIKAKRDIGVEFARLIGCLIVIGVHIKLADNVAGDYNFFRLILSCILADGVAVFWMISGCFLFRTKSYPKLLLRTVKTILVPLLILSALLLMFADFLFDGASLSESLPSFSKILGTVKGMLSLKPTVSGSGHLWYCYAYILLMLIFPILKSFSDWLNGEEKRQKVFLIISFAVIIFNDLNKNNALNFSHHAFNAVVPAAIQLIWGDILYKNKDKLLKHKDKRISPIIYLLAFFAVNVIRAAIILLTNSRSLLYWYTVFGFASAVFLLLFCFSVCNRVKENSFFEKSTLMLGSYTFLIYLLHIPLRNFLYRLGLKEFINAALSSFTSGVVFDLAYTIVMTLVIFLLTLAIAFILRNIVLTFKKLILKTK